MIHDAVYTCAIFLSRAARGRSRILVGARAVIRSLCCCATEALAKRRPPTRAGQRRRRPRRERRRRAGLDHLGCWRRSAVWLASALVGEGFDRVEGPSQSTSSNNTRRIHDAPPALGGLGWSAFLVSSAANGSGRLCPHTTRPTTMMPSSSLRLLLLAASCDLAKPRLTTLPTTTTQQHTQAVGSSVSGGSGRFSSGRSDSDLRAAAGIMTSSTTSSAASSPSSAASKKVTPDKVGKR